MDTPRAADLFLNVWSQAMATDELIKPGNPFFSRDRDPRSSRAYWLRVWADCVTLAQDIAQAQALAQQAIEIVDRIDGINNEPGEIITPPVGIES